MIARPTRPSLRLRLLRFGMRCFVKPRLRFAKSPHSAHRNLERSAPFLFSKPRGLQVGTDGPIQKVTVDGTPINGAILYFHGGAFMCGSPRAYRAVAGRLAKRCHAAVYLAKYPLVQDAPFPAAPNAARAAWDHVRAAGWAPDRIVIAGDSAGGNLAFGLLAQLLQDGIKPAGAVGFSPWLDLTLSGPSLTTNAKTDPLIPVSRMRDVVDLYLKGADPNDPRASPLFADFPNVPPALIQVGAGEALLSDAQRLAAKIGAILSVWPHCPHAWQVFDGRLPEANAAMRDVAAFVKPLWQAPAEN